MGDGVAAGCPLPTAICWLSLLLCLAVVPADIGIRTVGVGADIEASDGKCRRIGLTLMHDTQLLALLVASGRNLRAVLNFLLRSRDSYKIDLLAWFTEYLFSFLGRLIIVT